MRASAKAQKQCLLFELPTDLLVLVLSHCDGESLGRAARSCGALALLEQNHREMLWLALGETRLDQGRPDLAESLARRAASLAGNDPDNARSAQALLERSRRAR